MKREKYNQYRNINYPFTFRLQRLKISRTKKSVEMNKLLKNGVIGSMYRKNLTSNHPVRAKYKHTQEMIIISDFLLKIITEIIDKKTQAKPLFLIQDLSPKYQFE